MYKVCRLPPVSGWKGFQNRRRNRWRELCLDNLLDQRRIGQHGHEGACELLEVSGCIVCRDGFIILPDFYEEIFVLVFFARVEIVADIAFLFAGGFYALGSDALKGLNALGFKFKNGNNGNQDGVSF